MAKPKPAEKRGPLTVNIDESLRAQLEDAAKRSVRSVSGEVVKRLRDSLAAEPTAA
jgi:hypothetical protein